MASEASNLRSFGGARAHIARLLRRIQRHPAARRRWEKSTDLGPCCAITSFDKRVEQIRARIDSEHLRVFDGVMGRVDTAKLARLQDVYRDDFDPELPSNNDTRGVKYLDIAYWTADKLQRDHGLDLFDGCRRRILDIGCGAAHFGAVCEELGHEYVGIDISYDIGDSVAAILGLDRRILRLEAQELLPDSLGRFDMVTAFGSKFHHIGTEPNGAHICWTYEDWDYLLRDLTGNRMNYPGSLHFQVNGRQMTPDMSVSHEGLVDRIRAIGGRGRKDRTRMWLEVEGETGLI